MKKMDEMDREIQLRSMEWGYKAAIVSLCLWVLYNSYQTLAHGAEYQPLPSLMLCLTVCVQSLSQIAMKQKMVAGDEEYHEPNRLVQTVLAGIVVTAVVNAAVRTAGDLIQTSRCSAPLSGEISPFHWEKIIV